MNWLHKQNNKLSANIEHYSTERRRQFLGHNVLSENSKNARKFHITLKISSNQSHLHCMYVCILILWYDSKVCDKQGIKNQDAKIFKLIFLKTCAMVDRTL